MTTESGSNDPPLRLRGRYTLVCLAVPANLLVLASWGLLGLPFIKVTKPLLFSSLLLTLFSTLWFLIIREHSTTTISCEPILIVTVSRLHATSRQASPFSVPWLFYRELDRPSRAHHFSPPTFLTKGAPRRALGSQTALTPVPHQSSRKAEEPPPVGPTETLNQVRKLG